MRTISFPAQGDYPECSLALPYSRNAAEFTIFHTPLGWRYATGAGNVLTGIAGEEKVLEIMLQGENEWHIISSIVDGVSVSSASLEEVLDEIRVRKFSEISQAHREHVAGSVMTSLGFPMQFDMKDSLMVEGAIKIAQATGATTIYLTDANDVSHYDIPLADAQTVLLEMSTAFAQAHAKKQMLRDGISKAQTQSDLDRISW